MRFQKFYLLSPLLHHYEPDNAIFQSATTRWGKPFGHVMYSIYVLRNEKNGHFYIGYSGDIEASLGQHNAGKVKATRYIRPLSVAYTEAYATATEARKRERYLKSLKSHKAIEDLINNRAH